MELSATTLMDWWQKKSQESMEPILSEWSTDGPQIPMSGRGKQHF
jgi:hypothetical protein